MFETIQIVKEKEILNTFNRSQPKTFTSISSSALPTVLYETFVYKAALLGSLVLATELIKWIIYMKSEEMFRVGH